MNSPTKGRISKGDVVISTWDDTWPFDIYFNDINRRVLYVWHVKEQDPQEFEYEGMKANLKSWLEYMRAFYDLENKVVNKLKKDILQYFNWIENPL